MVGVAKAKGVQGDELYFRDKETLWRDRGWGVEVCFEEELVDDCVGEAGGEVVGAVGVEGGEGMCFFM